jgi:SAM-dependent methyltransferase
MKKKTPKIQFHLDPITHLVMKDRNHWISMPAAKARYDTHHNGEDNFEYIAYQKRIFDDFIGIYLKPGKSMDYGCGEGAVLKQFIEDLSVYDLFYHPDQSVFKQTFDNIILIEVVEHFEHPIEEFKRLNERLSPGGRLIIQTQFYEDFEAIQTWWYVRDTTHVAFYHLDTFKYLCERFNLKLIYTDNKSRVVLEKPVL